MVFKLHDNQLNSSPKVTVAHSTVSASKWGCEVPWDGSPANTAAAGDTWAAGPGVETACYDSHHPCAPLALGLQGEPTQEDACSLGAV